VSGSGGIRSGEAGHAPDPGPGEPQAGHHYQPDGSQRADGSGGCDQEVCEGQQPGSVDAEPSGLCAAAVRATDG